MRQKHELLREQAAPPSRGEGAIQNMNAMPNVLIWHGVFFLYPQLPVLKFNAPTVVVLYATVGIRCCDYHPVTNIT